MSVAPEFSRIVAVGKIGSTGIDRQIEADAAECRALALRFGVPAVTSLQCRFRIEAPLRGEVAADAVLRAEITRICVVSLEAFETTVQERFSLRFVPHADKTDDLDPEAPDELGYDGDQIDLGEAAAEQLALGLDPYPRMPGVPVPPDLAPAFPETAPEAHPFAALARRARGGKPDAGDA